MNSINATIEGMSRKGTLAGILSAYAYAALLVAGPWIFTVLGLAFLSAVPCSGSCTELTTFRSIIIYDSMFALIVSSPLAFIGGRYVSEQVRSGKADSVFYVLVLCLTIFGATSLLFAGPFYLFATTLEPIEKVLSVQALALIGFSWLLIPFVAAIRAYRTVLLGFGAGAVMMISASYLLPESQTGSLLLAFNASFTVINLVLLGALARRFDTRIVVDRELQSKLMRNWEIPAAGAIYALGLWADKLIMWYSGSADGLLVAGALRTMPSYDTAMFWSQLASIPVIAVFFVHVETRFSELVRSYHARMQQRASLRELNEIAHAIRNYVLSSMFNLFIATALVAAVMTLLSIVFMTALGLRPPYMRILRVSNCAMVFYTNAMFCFTFLLHLDLRRPALQIVSVFLALNCVLTVMFLWLGPDFHGYGAMIAATISLLVGFSLILKELSWLHYHAFVTNNPSL